ncbi:hypothetical protein TRFO_23307 [Tritrichomonas foetus]|uniref:AP180 N-terminal homology (ANTH) domain-containing protein n=1 Tax=Tritrichomonas foetus TaxID=1144522 RepID=A0A1J4K9X2_9EUKA|nr:hypothetical protein TRFO_23307 [Tritrichomonas foetus]|eukprot:OHT08231.1 hypothetical protein TRFO_23307 [Tritrichomonas foetus]
MFASTPPGEDWTWLGQLQGSYHKWTSSSLSSWLTKATKAKYDPPKAKHVRRILVASLRDASISPYNVSRYLIEERPWRNDARIAAKCLYIILILLQYQEELSNMMNIAKLTDSVLTYWTEHIPEEKHQIYSSIASRIGSIIHSKLVFHMNHNGVHGNFAVRKGERLEDLIPDLRRHLISSHYETSGVQAAVTNSEDFTATVLWQPMVDETVSAYRLLKSIDKSQESDAAFRDTEYLITRLPEYPYIATTVIFPMPGEKITIPRERFPRRV